MPSLWHQGFYNMEFAIYTSNDAYLQFWYCLIQAIKIFFLFLNHLHLDPPSFIWIKLKTLHQMLLYVKSDWKLKSCSGEKFQNVKCLQMDEQTDTIQHITKADLSLKLKRFKNFAINSEISIVLLCYIPERATMPPVLLLAWSRWGYRFGGEHPPTGPQI